MTEATQVDIKSVKFRTYLNNDGGYYRKCTVSVMLRNVLETETWVEHTRETVLAEWVLYVRLLNTPNVTDSCKDIRVLHVGSM